MNINEYFIHANQCAYPRLSSNISYSKTVENFYENFIRHHLEKIFVNRKSYFLKWCEILDDYANNCPLPIFWVRKFESGSGQEHINDNRRTGTTVMVDKSKSAIAAFVFISNFDAQELYNIILNVDPSAKPDEFKTLMLTGKYKFHYDSGLKSNESAITSFECLAHANSLGVFNRANLYLAHITDVNGAYCTSENFVFTNGIISEWNALSTYAGYNFSDLFSTDTEKKIRVIEYGGDAATLKKYLKAHFFRFVHPFNYYLVPGQNYEINSIFGKIKKSIGEYRILTDYVRYRMYVDFIKNDSDLVKYYEQFESAILIDEKDKLSLNIKSIENESKKLGETIIHLVYGSSIGKEGQLLEKLSKKIANVPDLYNLYAKYTVGDSFVFLDASEKEVCSYTPRAISNFIELVEKLLHTNFGVVCSVRIELRKAASKPKAPTKRGLTKTSSPLSAKRGSVSHRKYNDNDRFKVAAFFLRNDIGLESIEKIVLKCKNRGSTASYMLHALGINTGKGGHKGLLRASNLDAEIVKATGKFKETLEEIKKRGL